MKTIENTVIAECKNLVKEQGQHLSGLLMDVIKLAVDRTIFLVKQDAMTKIDKIK